MKKLLFFLLLPSVCLSAPEGQYPDTCESYAQLAVYAGLESIAKNPMSIEELSSYLLDNLEKSHTDKKHVQYLMNMMKKAYIDKDRYDPVDMMTKYYSECEDLYSNTENTK